MAHGRLCQCRYLSPCFRQSGFFLLPLPLPPPPLHPAFFLSHLPSNGQRCHLPSSPTPLHSISKCLCPHIFPPSPSPFVSSEHFHCPSPALSRFLPQLPSSFVTRSLQQKHGPDPQSVTRTHKYNERDHHHEQEEELPKWFAKSGHVDCAPDKVKKNGAGKSNWSDCSYDPTPSLYLTNLPQGPPSRGSHRPVH